MSATKWHKKLRYICLCRQQDFVAEILPSAVLGPSPLPPVSHQSETTIQNVQKSTSCAQNAHNFISNAPGAHKLSNSNRSSTLTSDANVGSAKGSSCGSLQQLVPEPQRVAVASDAPAISRMSRIIEESVRQDSMDNTEGKDGEWAPAFSSSISIF